jgi:hypothetical protein
MASRREIAFFTQTCTSCFNDIEIPVLGDFSSYGETLSQTPDGKQFALVDLLDNPAFDLILNALEGHALDQRTRAYIAQSILCSVSDPVHGTRYSIEYPRCPLCGRMLQSWSDEHFSSRQRIDSPTWAAFLTLGEQDRTQLIDHLVGQWDQRP